MAWSVLLLVASGALFYHGFHKPRPCEQSGNTPQRGLRWGCRRWGRRGRGPSSRRLAARRAPRPRPLCVAWSTQQIFATNSTPLTIEITQFELRNREKSNCENPQFKSLIVETTSIGGVLSSVLRGHLRLRSSVPK